MVMEGLDPFPAIRPQSIKSFPQWDKPHMPTYTLIAFQSIN